MTENRNPEQVARDHIDEQLKQAGWKVQSLKKINLNDGIGQAVREYQTNVGPADYVLFVNKRAVGVIEAKREEEGHRLTVHEAQTEGYAEARLKWVNNKVPLPFLYESTGVINLPEPDDLAAEIIENVEAGLNSFRMIAGGL